MPTFRGFIRSVLGLASESPALASPPGRRTVIADGVTVELELSSQVLAIHAPPDREFHGRRGATGGAEAPLSATLGPIDSTDLVSASVLAQKAKIFDDGLYAVVEVAAQEGAGLHAGKAALLASPGGALAGADRARWTRPGSKP